MSAGSLSSIAMSRGRRQFRESAGLTGKGDTSTGAPGVQTVRDDRLLRGPVLVAQIPGPGSKRLRETGRLPDLHFPFVADQFIQTSSVLLFSGPIPLVKLRAIRHRHWGEKAARPLEY